MIGVLCGLKSEARIADGMAHAIMVGCGAARQERARALVRHMVEQGATRLISFGLCGAVSPDLVAGDLVLGSSVMSRDQAWEAEQAFYAPLIEQLPSALCGSVWGGAKIAARAQDKALILRRTGCMAVDTESHIVAEAASRAALPFNIVRAVCDTADMDLPSAALVPLLKEGGVDRRAVWRLIISEPRQLFPLARLGRNAALALRTLREAVAVLADAP